MIFFFFHYYRLPRKFFKFSRNDREAKRNDAMVLVIANEVKQSIIQNLAFDNSTLV
ncbi:hypothetical protein [Helicobacter rodentium]|uniref:hypothetical protein n=1 Tax=Helicobacter rodentium TaxID=59617 RepID=UPI000AFDB1C0|nr:hypothetical protein [Helicobacter rodentium]